MSIRYLIAAALMASACGAQADVLPANTGTGQSSFLTGWTTGTGASVLGSGVLNNASLVGGVGYGSNSSSLVDALVQKASASVGAAGGEMQLTVQQGISGTYVTGISHAKLAALAGNGVSVVGSANGAQIVAASGSTGGAAPASSGGGASGGAGTGGTPGSGGSGTGGTPGSGGSGTGGSSGSTTGGSVAIDTPVSLPPAGPFANDGLGNGGANGGGSGLGGGANAGPSGNVPEPSTVALMLAGMLGVVGLRRRAR